MESAKNHSLPLTQYRTSGSKNVWLFNIKQDPLEQHDLSNTKSQIVKMLLDRISVYQKTAVRPQPDDNDIKCDPALNGYAWKPWVQWLGIV